MTTMFLHPGKRLGSNYELEAIVGTGQFGQVWRARKLNPPSDIPVALKVPLDPHRGEEVLMADGKYRLDLPKHPVWSLSTGRAESEPCGSWRWNS